MKKMILGSFARVSSLMPVSLKAAIVRLPVVSSLFRGVLNATVEDGLSVVTVTAGTLQGMRVALNMKTEKSRWLGTYEPELDAAVKKFVRLGMAVYDVGANIGYVSLWFAKAVGDNGKVFAFEPLPENAERVRKNIGLNGLSNVTVVQAAVIDARRDVTFYQHDSVGMGKAEGSAGRDDQQYKASFSVPGIDLDSYVFEDHHPLPDVIKIDIEGGEVMALPGMRRVLREAKPILMLELHGPESERVAWQELTQLGYSLRPMEDDGRVITSLQELGWKAYVIAIPGG